MNPGSVSTVELRPIIEHLTKQRFPHTGVMGLANKVQLDESLIRRILSGETTSCEFDSADRILCALGSPMAWQSPELRDVYMGASFIQECELHSCHISFPESKPRNHVKRYCSPRCRSLAQKVKRGEKPGDRYAARGRFRCGHKITAENSVPVKTAAGTKRTCRTCRRVKQIVWQREYRERKRNQKESMNRDLRDPKIVGQELLDLCDKQKQIQPSLLADLNGLPAPDWTGDGFMSSNPAEHHSKVSQAGNERIPVKQ